MSVSARVAARLAWSFWTLAVILVVLFLLLLSIGGQPADSTDLVGVGGILLPVIYPLTVVLLATMGALIATRHPQNWIGWLCCAWGLLFALELFAAAYATASVNIMRLYPDRARAVVLMGNSTSMPSTAF